MELGKEAKERLSRYISRRLEEYKSFAEMHRDFKSHVVLAGIKRPLAMESVRKWRRQDCEAIQEGSLRQLAAFRGEPPAKTQAWLLGEKYIPKAAKVHGEIIDADNRDDRESLFSMWLGKASPEELAKAGHRIIDKSMGFLGDGRISPPEQEAPKNQRSYTLSPEKEGAWAEMKKVFLSAIIGLGFDPTDPEDRAKYTEEEDVDLDSEIVEAFFAPKSQWEAIEVSEEEVIRLIAIAADVNDSGGTETVFPLVEEIADKTISLEEFLKHE